MERETQANCIWADVALTISNIGEVHIQRCREVLQRQKLQLEAAVMQWRTAEQDDIKMEVSHVQNLCEVSRRAAARTENIMKLRMAEMEVVPAVCHVTNILTDEQVTIDCIRSVFSRL